MNKIVNFQLTVFLVIAVGSWTDSIFSLQRQMINEITFEETQTWKIGKIVSSWALLTKKNILSEPELAIGSKAMCRY